MIDNHMNAPEDDRLEWPGEPTPEEHAEAEEAIRRTLSMDLGLAIRQISERNWFDHRELINILKRAKRFTDAQSPRRNTDQSEVDQAVDDTAAGR